MICIQKSKGKEKIVFLYVKIHL